MARQSNTIAPEDNPIQDDYDRRFDEITQQLRDAEANPTDMSAFEDDYINPNTAPSEDEEHAILRARNQDDVARREQQGSGAESGWSNKWTPPAISEHTQSQKILNNIVKFAKKRGAVASVSLLSGIVALAVGGLFGTASLTIALTENFTDKNDSASTSMQRRFLKVIGLTSGADNSGLCNTKIKCYRGKISNNALNKMLKKGAVAKFDDGSLFDGTNKTGYPDKNPAGYDIDVGDGKGSQFVSSENMTDFLSDKKNSKIAAKILGTGGAFNMRYRAWVGKHITSRLFSKFALNRKGGYADGDTTKRPTSEKLAAMKEKIIKSVPGMERAEAMASRIKTRISKTMGRVSKAGAAYSASVAGCMIAKTPKIVAAGVVAVQLAQILPIVHDLVLSPGAKEKASYISNLPPEDADNVNSKLTEQTPRESDGKMTSALDSPILLSAIGVNKNKPALSSFAPGYAILTSKEFKIAIGVEKDLKPACDVIMSPVAMNNAAAVDAVATVAASATLIGGVLKIALSWALSTIISTVVTQVVGNAAMKLLTEVASNDDIPQAQGEALGDVLGIGAAAFFSVGGMGRHLPTLKMSQLGSYSKMAQETREFEKQMDIASLSPFDTSSKYTFLGSIVHNTQMAMVANGGYGASIGSNLASLAASLPSLPFRMLSPTASADVDLNAQYCGYASEFGFDANSNEDLPAINMAGLPCTGLTPEQDTMDTEEAIDLITDPDLGWIDDSKPFQPSDTIDDMLKNKYIVPDSPLADFITTCGDATTGDFIFNTAGCTFDSNLEPGDPNAVNENLATDCYSTKDAKGNDTTVCVDMPPPSETQITGVKDPRSLTAMTVFLLDYQIHQAINGEDDGVATNQTGSDPASTNPAVSGEGFPLAMPADGPVTSPYGDRIHPVTGVLKFHSGVDIGAGCGTQLIAAESGSVIESGMAGGYGNRVVIDHGTIDGMQLKTSYNHAQSLSVSVGDQVTRGQQIGAVGTTGTSTGCHLHFELWINGELVDPWPYISGDGT